MSAVLAYSKSYTALIRTVKDHGESERHAYFEPLLNLSPRPTHSATPSPGLIKNALNASLDAMRITNLIELRAWAEENCPEEYARLPAAGSYEITAIGSCVCVYVGTIARTEIHHDLISFENDRLKVQAHLELGKAMPILVAGNFTRLTSSYYGKIELSQPFCWIWPGLEYSIGLDKFNALVRYVCMVRGFPGNLSDMPLGLQEVFPQLCADITRGQGTQSIESSWKGGKHGGKRLKEGGGGEMNGAKKDGVSTNNNVTDRQQNCRDVVSSK